jgi:hypothetical protein
MGDTRDYMWIPRISHIRARAPCNGIAVDNAPVFALSWVFIVTPLRESIRATGTDGTDGTDVYCRVHRLCISNVL